MRLWSSRFDGNLSQETLEYTQTIDIDRRMISNDLWVDLVHVLMLCRQDIVPTHDGRAIVTCLLQLYDKAIAGELVLRKDLEDVHLNIESTVIEMLGVEVGGKLHTARSRNDQVVTDARLYIREEIIALSRLLVSLVGEMTTKAESHLETPMLGHTHTQGAQPISYAFWLTSYASIFQRDIDRLSHAYETVNQNPLGAGALAGTSFSIDRNMTTKMLAFDKTLKHALDATSSRDFFLETASTLAILMSNVSRLCEEIVYGSSLEFGLFDVGDYFSTGSSIMPQKKNPVVVELARGKSGVVFGSLMDLLTIVKGVGMGYSCDLQQDKPAMWRALDASLATISILRSQVHTLKYNPKQAIASCWGAFSTATELANHIVSRHKISFRVAYQLVGNLVKQLSKEDTTLDNTRRVAALLQEAGILSSAEEIREAVDPGLAVKLQISEGGTSPRSVSAMIEELSHEIKNLETVFRTRSDSIEERLNMTLRVSRAFCNGQDITGELSTM